MSGSIYRRRKPDGSWSKWYAVIDAEPGPEGERRQHTTSHNTRRDAVEWLALVAARRAEQHDASGPTVGEFLDEWLAAKQSLRPSTLVSYAGHVRRHLKPLLGDRALARVSRADVAAVFAQIQAEAARRDAPLSPRSLALIRATLASAMADAVSEGLIERNPVRGVQFPSAPPRDPAQLWSLEQLREFLQRIHDDDLYPVFVVMAMRGLRRGEVLGLRWCDVDLDNATLHVRQQLVAVAGNVFTGPPKSAAGRRSVALDAFTLEVLVKHQGAMRIWAATRDAVMAPTDLVFRTDAGQAWKPAFVTRKFGRLVAESGLPAMRLHDLRHLSATLGLQTGESLKEVQARLGHSSIQVTANIYTEVSTPLAKASAARLAEAVIGDAS